MTGGNTPGLADVPDRRLFARLRRLVNQRAKLLIECGVIIAELYRRGHSFRKIGETGGFPWQSGYRWYLKAMEEDGGTVESSPPESDRPDSTD